MFPRPRKPHCQPAERCPAVKGGPVRAERSEPRSGALEGLGERSYGTRRYRTRHRSGDGRSSVPQPPRNLGARPVHRTPGNSTRDRPAAIVGRVGSAGAINVARPPVWVSDNALIVRPDNGTELRYIAYVLPLLNLGDDAAQTAQPLITQTQVSERNVPRPPLTVQNAISDYLDRETARIDAVIAAKRRMVELLEERLRCSVPRLALKESMSDWSPLPRVKRPSTFPSGSVKLAIRRPPPTSHVGSLTASPPVGSWRHQQEEPRFERSIRTRGAIAEPRATRGTPGITRRAPASVTPRSATPNADGRRRDRHDHGDPEGDPRESGRASRADQAER
jgi:hypothetical protein